MKTNYFALLMILSFRVIQAREPTWTDEDRDWEAKQVALWEDNLAKASTLPPTEKLESLALGLRNMGHRVSMDGHSQAVDQIYDRLQEEFLSIPDHAKYFSDKIEESWKSHAERVRTFEAQPEWNAALEKAEQTTDISEEMFDLLGRMWGDYPEISSKNLGMLGHIPSTESVRELGHYLWKRDEPGIRYKSPNTERPAAESLTGLISDGPMQTWLASYEDVAKWQKWFDEVKAGKRTFRFVGSNVDYTLEGPADADSLKRIKEKTPGMQRPNITKKHGTPSDALASANQNRPVFHGGLIAAILLCLTALAFLFRCRKVARMGGMNRGHR